MSVFDAGLHPTLNGEWVEGRKGLTFADVGRLLQTEEMAGACALGLPGVGDYEHIAFYRAAREVPGLIPVAALTGQHPDSWEAELKDIASVGYKAVHFHPRSLGVNHAPGLLTSALAYCFREGLVMFYCTFYSSNHLSMPSQDPLWEIVKAVKKTPEAAIVLLHGGGHRLLEYAETFRYFPSVLLDLSFTLTRYANSSVKWDILHVLKTMDQRVCVGSDSPDVPWQVWKDELLDIQGKVDPERWSRIIQGNIVRLLDPG